MLKLFKSTDKKKKQKAADREKMGCGSSKPEVKHDANKGTGAVQAAPAGTPKESPHPDVGLKGTHDLVKFLGRGGTGDTYLFTEKATGEEVAIKLMKRPLPKVIMPNILREIRIQSELGEGHVNVIKAKEALLTENHLCLVMEYAACGSMTGFVAEKWQNAQQTGLFLQEDEARYFFRVSSANVRLILPARHPGCQHSSVVLYVLRSILHCSSELSRSVARLKASPAFPLPYVSCYHTGLLAMLNTVILCCAQQFIMAVEYCHKHNVAHRDLKLDNTLLSDDSPPLIKLCDFGFAKEWADDAQMFTHIGTPVYMSPELINSREGAKGYDGQSVDVWASGILLIVMLLGTFPFDHIEHPDPNTSEAHLEVW
ncbi:hypothetical protein MMC07_000443 [Pseudocyphellaria aurata]|nr:hypothetical protein [Pseudocyphellaria aurata]